MGLLKESELRARADRGTPMQKSASIVLNEKVQAATKLTQFDIFLSHSLSDQKLILGIWFSLEDMGYNVYVDWIHDRQLGRENVTKETAQTLRLRMNNSKSLFFATTENSSRSKWMPWELGYMDGLSGKAAILPITRSSESSFTGQEYLGIYPYVSKDLPKGESIEKLWINESSTCYVLFDQWLTGYKPSQRS